MIKITLNEIHPSLNKWTHWHWYIRAREKNRWNRDIYYLLREARIHPPLDGSVLYEKAKIRVIYYFKDNKARDKDNYTPKFILDALRYSHIIGDDSVKDSDVDWELRLKTGETKTEVIVEER